MPFSHMPNRRGGHPFPMPGNLPAARRRSRPGSTNPIRKKISPSPPRRNPKRSTGENRANRANRECGVWKIFFKPSPNEPKPQLTPKTRRHQAFCLAYWCLGGERILAPFATNEFCKDHKLRFLRFYLVENLCPFAAFELSAGAPPDFHSETPLFILKSRSCKNDNSPLPQEMQAPAGASGCNCLIS